MPIDSIKLEDDLNEKKHLSFEGFTKFLQDVRRHYFYTVMYTYRYTSVHISITKYTIMRISLYIFKTYRLCSSFAKLFIVNRDFKMFYVMKRPEMEKLLMKNHVKNEVLNLNFLLSTGCVNKTLPLWTRPMFIICMI